MSMRNFAAALQGFGNNILPGMEMGRQVKDARNKRGIEKIEKQGMIDARAQNKTDTYDANVQTFNPQGKGGAPTTYGAGGQNFRDEGEAKKNVKQNVNSVMDNYMKNTAPKIAEEYMAQGNVEKAEAWNQYISSKRGQNAMRDWSKGYIALSNGDWDTGAKVFGEYYTEYVDDNVSVKSHKMTKDEDGKINGIEYTMFDSDTGKETKMPMGLSNLVQLGTASNPGALFSMAAEQQATATKLRGEDANARAAERREFLNAAALKGIDQEYAIQMYDRKNADDIDMANLTHKQALELQSAKGGSGSGGSAPADVQTVEWMVANNVAPNEEAGWKLLRQKTSMTEMEFATEYAKMAASAQPTYGAGKKSTEELIAQGREVYRNFETQPARPPNPAAGGMPQWDDSMLQSGPNLSN